MQLSHLSLTDFRNYARLDINVPDGATLFVGGNAQGKTSLLEAIYYLAIFSSFQASSDRQLVNFHADREPVAVARIKAHIKDRSLDRESRPSRPPGKEGHLSASGSHNLEIRLILPADNYNNHSRIRKEILVDGVRQKVGDAIGLFNAVLFLPHMLRIVEGPPDERRRYLNMAMVQVLPNYAQTLSAYSRTLSQRNALLRSLSERGGDLDQLNYWDENLAVLASQIIHTRIQTISELEQFAANIHNELTREMEVLRLSYQPSYDPLPEKPGQFELPIETPLDRSGLTLEEIQSGFFDRLGKLRREEIARGVTTIGPHRDEFRLLSNGIDLGLYGSRGQARTAVLAMKLAEVAWMRERKGQWPVLLLDEVLAELDPSRRADLLTRLAESEQVMLTTTDLDLFTEQFIQSANLWQIHGGQIINHL